MFYIQLENFQDSYFPKSHDFILPLTNVNIINLLTKTPSDIISFFKQKNVDLVLAFNGINFTDRFFYEKLNIPLGIILVDHPFYHLSRIQTYKGNNTFICMLDLEHLDCFEECIDANVPIAWLPHGGTEIKLNKNINKEYDVIFPASINDYVHFEKILLELPNGIVKEFALNLYEKGKQNYNIPLYKYFKDELNYIGIDKKI